MGYGSLGDFFGRWDGWKMLERSWSDFEQSNSIDKYQVITWILILGVSAICWP